MSLLENMWAALGEDPGALALVRSHADAIPLDAALPVGALVHDGIAAASLSASLLHARRTHGAAGRVELDSDHVATAVTSERHFRWRGEPMNAWAELSGFWPAKGGWVRTHANYPHHRERLLRALGLPEATTGDDLLRALGTRSAQEIDDVVTAAGGIATVVRRPEEWREHPHAAAVDAQPLVSVTRIGDAPPTEPHEQFRVLDLTRVIAGPVATRTLALWGADVLRVDPPTMPELEWQHLDTGAGKRTVVLDAHDPAFGALLDRSEVLVTGYRTNGVRSLGLDPHAVAARRPGIVVARLTAWGSTGPFADRRGFDSIVQAATGISWIESADGSRPGALPAQALDHTAGYLLAAGITSALRRRADEGGSWLVEVSLARVAHALMDAPRARRAKHAAFTPTVVEYPDLVIPAPAAGFDGSATTWPSAPVPWGSSAPAWLPRAPRPE